MTFPNLLLFHLTFTLLLTRSEMVSKFNNDKEYLYSVNLQVTEQVKKLCSKTSNPKWVTSLVIKYLGIQTYRQTKIGNMWFMRSMLARNLFSHEIQVLAAKTVHGYKWRHGSLSDSKIEHQCKKIVETRMKI